MTNLPIKVRVFSKWLAVRAYGWSFLFRSLDAAGIVKRAIHSKSNSFDLEISTQKSLWIVSSVIQPRLSPFSYSKVRSVFSHDSRLAQTRETIASIKSTTDRVVIAILEGSKYAGIYDLADQDVVVFQLKSRILRFVVNGPYKGLGEAILLMLIRSEADASTYVRKISGRYTVSQAIETRPVLFREQSGSAISVSYGMTLNVFEKWQSYLETNLSALSKGISMEQVLYNFTKSNSFKPSPLLGVSGRTAVTGGEIHV